MDEEGALVALCSVDQDGRLITADPRLLALQLGAGGEAGGVLVVPQLANLALMARNLGILVSRCVFAADGANDLDLWVTAQLEGDIVNLAVSGWTKRAALEPDPALREARARDFAQLEADGEWAVDEHFIVTSLSPGLCAILEGGVDAAIGKPITQLMRLVENDAGDLPMLLGAMQRIIFYGQRAEIRTMPHVQLYLNAAPRFGGEGEFLGYAGAYALVDRALVAHRNPPQPAAIDTGFASRLDGALRGPLAKIIANADEIGEMRDGPLRYSYEGYANDISAAGRHLLGLVDDLVDLQAVERPEFRIETEAVDLADIARRAAGLLRVRASDKGVRIDMPPRDEVLMAQGDFRRLLQIMVNLLSNAVRYSPEGSSIWLRIEGEGDLAAVIVADQGKGIAPQDQIRIFEKFERVDNNEPGGSGLGLYISRKLARAMGGDITVDSAPGRGARFVLTLGGG